MRRRLPCYFGDAFMLDVPAHTTTTFASKKENKFFGDVHRWKIRLPPFGARVSCVENRIEKFSFGGCIFNVHTHTHITLTPYYPVPATTLIT